MKVVWIFTFALAFALPTFHWAQEQGQPTSSNVADEFGSEARSAYLLWQKARREADMVYLAGLRGALVKVTRQGNLKEATAIQGEIKRLEAELEEAEKVPLAKFLIGTSWVNPTNGVVVSLGEEGKGVRTARNSESYFTYQVVSEEKFTIRWASAPMSEFRLAEDRQSIVGGGATWKLEK
jgi:hypothetical protein